MLKSFAGVVLGICVAATTAMAQGTWTPQQGIENLPRGANVRQGNTALGWAFHPITDGTQVTAFFGELDSEDAFGSNVKMMYFLNDGQGGWTSYGWAESNVDGAIAWIRSEHGAAALDRDHQFGTAPVTSATPVAPELMKGGIFVSDPNVEIFEQMEPDAAQTLISWLVEAGYAAAPKLAETLITEFHGGPGVLNDLMAYFSNQAEYTLYPLKATFATTTAVAWPCDCITTSTTTYLPAPGPAGLDPDFSPNPKPIGASCQWKYRRQIGTVTTTSTGDTYWLCNDCAATSTAILYEYTTVEEIRTGIGCPTTPAGGIPPGNPWTPY